jgi:NDP-sugar pyrophosphorylase family protein
VNGKSYLDMTDFLESELDTGKVNAFPVHEYWLDIGRIKEYESAHESFSNGFTLDD